MFFTYKETNNLFLNVEAKDELRRKEKQNWENYYELKYQDKKLTKIKQETV